MYKVQKSVEDSLLNVSLRPTNTYQLEESDRELVFLNDSAGVESSHEVFQVVQST